MAQNSNTIILSGENYLSVIDQSVTANAITLSGTNVTGTLPIAKGGTGSASQNFVDLTTAQTVAGVKTFSSNPTFSAISSGRMLFTSTGGLVASNSGLLFDNTNTRITIGSTTNGGAKINVITTSDSAFKATGYALGPAIITARANGTEGVPTVLVANNTIGLWSGQGHTGSAFSNISSNIQMQAATNWSTSNTDSYILFGTTPTGTTSVVQRTQIWQDGSFRLFDNSAVAGGLYTGFKAPSTVTSAGVFTLPGADGTSGQVLTTDGARTLSWSQSSPRLYNIVIGTSSNCDYVYNGTDIGSQINTAIAAFTADGGVIFIQAGDYTLTTPITFKNKANLHIIGAGMEQTTITSNLTSNRIVDGRNTTLNGFGTPTWFKWMIRDISFDNTAKTNAGSIGFDIDWASDFTIQNVVIKNVETGFQLKGGSFYNNFYNLKIENTVTGYTQDESTGTHAVTDNPNANKFVSCKILTSTNAVVVNKGNQIEFYGTELENSNNNIYFNGVGNMFHGGRLENNDLAGAVVYITFGANSQNCVVDNPYISGNEWISATSSIVDSGTGNNITCTATYQDQFIKLQRDLVTAGDFTTFKRTGSGDGKAVVIAEDSYTPSGSPTQFLAKTVRAGSKFFSGELSGVEKIRIDEQGRIVTEGTVDGMFTPSYSGFHAWTFDPTATVNGSTPTGGTLQVVRLRLSKAETITNVFMQCTTAGILTTNCYAALYDTSGNLLATSNDLSASMGTTGTKTFVFGTPYSASVGDILVAFWATATTTVPALGRAAGTAIANANLVTSTFRYATADTGLTTTAPATLGTRTSGSIAWWLAIA